MIQKLPIFLKKFPGQRNQEKKKRILKRREELPQLPNKELAPFDELPETPFEIKMITAALFFHVSKQKVVKLFSTSLKNVEKTSKFKQRIDPATKLPPELHEFFECFFEKKKQTNYHPIDFTIIKLNS